MPQIQEFDDLTSAHRPTWQDLSIVDATQLPAPRTTVVLEQTLGHVIHSATLRRLVAEKPRIEPSFAPIEYAPTTSPPGCRACNWTVPVRGGGSTTASLDQSPQSDRRHVRAHPVPAVLLPGHLRRTATIVSLDATPIRYDELGEHYEHRTAGAPGASRSSGGSTEAASGRPGAS